MEGERERSEALETFRTSYSIGDAVITTDASGRVNLMNPVAETLTGWREADAAGGRARSVPHRRRADASDGREPGGAGSPGKAPLWVSRTIRC